MERNIQDRTERKLNLYDQDEDGSVTALMDLNSSEVRRCTNMDTILEPQILATESSRLTTPSYYQENYGLAHQNDNVSGYKPPSFQMSLQSSICSGYHQERSQVDIQTPDYGGYQLQNYGIDHQIEDSSQLHQQSYDRTHQSINTNGHLQQVDSVGHQNAMSGGFGQTTYPVSNVVYKGKSSRTGKRTANACQRKLETPNTYCTANPSLLINQNVHGGALLPNYSPRGTIDREIDSRFPSSGREGDANLLLQPQEGCSSSIPPSSTLDHYSQQQNGLPGLQQTFVFQSDQIADSRNVATFSASGKEANYPYQQDVARSQNQSYTSNSCEGDSLIDLFVDCAFFEELDKNTNVFSNPVRAICSPGLNEPHRVERTSLSLDSNSSGTINSPYSEISYSPSTDAQDSPNSEAQNSPTMDTSSVPSSTPFPSVTGAISKRALRAPRHLSTSSSSSSTSCSSPTNLLASSKNSKSNKEKQRHRLKNADYAAMTPDERQNRDLHNNKISSHKSRVKKKSDQGRISQLVGAKVSDNEILTAYAGGLEDVRKVMINTLLAQGFTRQSIIDILRANGESETMILSLFQGFGN